MSTSHTIGAHAKEVWGKSDKEFASDYLQKLKKLYKVDEKVQLNSFFIDVFYDKDDVDEEREFKTAMEALWKSIQQKRNLKLS